MEVHGKVEGIGWGRDGAWEGEGGREKQERRGEGEDIGEVEGGKA